MIANTDVITNDLFLNHIGKIKDLVKSKPHLFTSEKNKNYIEECFNNYKIIYNYKDYDHNNSDQDDGFHKCYNTKMKRDIAVPLNKKHRKQKLRLLMMLYNFNKTGTPLDY
jgi:hypothetical protein